MSNIETALPGKPVKRNITATRNDTFLYQIVGWNKDGTPYDFTGHEFIMQVKENREEGEDPVLDIPDSAFTIGQNQAGQDAGVNNLVTIEYDATNMDVAPKDYIYDIQMTDAASKIQTIQKERDYFRVEQDVSQ